MTDPGSRLPTGTVVTAFFAAAALNVTLSSFGFVLVPMQTELGFTTDSVNALAFMPAAGSLLVVFVAGSLADRWGPRRLLMLAWVVYIVGATAIGLASSLTWVVVGRICDGVSGVTMAIVALSVINSLVTEPGKRARVFGVYTAITPLTFLVVPPLSALIVEWVGWRAVSLIPVLLGVGAFVATLRFVPREGAGSSGELWTPLLAGVALAGFALGVTNYASNEALSSGAFVTATVAIVALVILKRRLTSPNLRLAWCRQRGMALLLAAVGVAAMPNLFFYTNLLLQYRYVVPLVTVAVLMMVPQACAVVGGLLSGPISARVGAPQAAMAALFVCALMSLSRLVVTPEAPIWVPVLALAISAAPISFIVGPIMNAFLHRVPADTSGVGSSVGMATWTLGGVIGGAVTGAVAFGAFQARLGEVLASDGMPFDQAQAVALQIRNGAIVDKLASTLSNPYVRDDLMSRGPGLLEAQSFAFAAAGVVSAALYFTAGALMALYLRRIRTAPQSSDVPAH